MADTLRIYKRPFMLVIGSGVSIMAFFIGGVSLVTNVDGSVLTVVLGILLLIVAILSVRNLVWANDARPAIEIDDSGILVRDVSATQIPWSGITNAKLWKTRAAWNISLTLMPETFKNIQPSFSSRLFSRKTVIFMVSYLDESPDRVMKLIQAHRSDN